MSQNQDEFSEMRQKSKPVSKMRLTVSYLIAMFLLDRWLFKPLADIAKHRGPFIVFGKKPKRRRSAKQGVGKMKIAGFSLMALLVIALTAILASAAFSRFAPAKVKEIVEGK